jgi:TolB-like protein
MLMWRSYGRSSVPSGISTVAVLPFANVGGDPKEEYFSDGMTDAFALALTRLPSLRVAGRTSSYSFKGKNTTAQEVGQALKVEVVIDGSVQRSGDRIRIFVELSKASDGLAIWSTTVEKKTADIFQLQDEVTRELLSAIAPALSGKTAQTVTASNHRTTNPAAYDQYLRGRYLFLKRGANNLIQAIDFFQRAIATDPSFALAYAGLAETYVVLPTYMNVPPDSMAALVTASANRAIALDPMLGEAYAAKAYALAANLRFAESEREFTTAIELDPENPTIRHWHSILLNNMGRSSAAYVEEARAETIDPLSAVFSNHQAWTLLYLGRIAESKERDWRSMAQDSTYPLPYGQLAMDFLVEHKPDSALLMLNHRGISGTNPRWAAMMALAYAELGRWQDVDRFGRGAGTGRPSATMPLIMAMINDNRSAALDALEAGFTPRGGLIYTVLNPSCDPLVEPLADEPRYKALLVRLGVPECTTRTKWAFPVRGHQASHRP